jgi:hypothetical protein
MASATPPPPPTPLLVPCPSAPADAGSLALPLAWQEEVTGAYVLRGQPESILEFVSASLRSCAPADRPAGDFALQHTLAAYAAAQRLDALLHCYASSPWELRTPGVQRTVLAALARAGRVSDVLAVCAGDKRHAAQQHPLLLAPLILAHGAAGDLESALVVARASAVARACALSGAPPQLLQAGGGGGGAAADGRSPLTSAPFDALIEAAGLAGAPHYARAVFECLTLHDLGHAASLGAQISHTSAALSMGLPSRDAAASAVMLETQKAIKDELRAALEGSSSSSGSGSGSASGAGSSRAAAQQRGHSPLDAYLSSVAATPHPAAAAAALSRGAPGSLPGSLTRAAALQGGGAAPPPPLCPPHRLCRRVLPARGGGGCAHGRHLHCPHSRLRRGGGHAAGAGGAGAAQGARGAGARGGCARGARVRLGGARGCL